MTVPRFDRPRAGDAFTLIELLVVVAVIALLIAILLPALDGARQQGKSVVCLSNLRSLGLAVQNYLDRSDDYFPSYGYKHGGESDAGKSWINLLAAEYARRGGEVDGSGTGATLRGQVRDVRRCPSDRSLHFTQPRTDGAGAPLWRQTSYASNYYLVAEDPAALGKQERFDHVSRIGQPSSTIYWVEMAETGEYATADHVHPELWAFGDSRLIASEQIVLDRHSRRANYGMVDGHAESLSFERTYLIDPEGSDIYSNTISWFFNKYDPDVAK